MLRSSCFLPAILVCGWLAVPATAQVEATFTKVTTIKPAFSATYPNADKTRAAVLSAGGEKLACVDDKGRVRVGPLKRPEKSWSFPSADGGGNADATSIAWSANEKTIVTGHADGTVRAFSAASGEKIWQRKRHDSRVNDVAISRNGKIVASCGNDKTVRVYNDKGEQTYVSNLHSDRVLSVDLTYNGKFVLSGGRGGHVFLAGTAYEPEKTTPILVRRFKKSDVPIVRVCLDRNTSLTDPLEFVDPKSKTVGDPQTDPINVRLLTADKAGLVTYYDLEKTAPMRRRNFDAPIIGVAMSPSSDKAPTAIVGTKKGAFAYRPSDTDPAGWRLEIPVPYTVAIASDGKTCAVGGDPNADMKPATVWVYVVN